MIIPALLLVAALQRPQSVQVTLVDDEAAAVLAILDQRAAHRAITAADWARLTRSEGYRRLQRREAAMNRAFTDSTFQAFVMSDTLLARRPELSRAFRAWRHVDVREPASRAFRYLPAGSVLRARMYIEIKPRTNSFVFRGDGDSLPPGLFLYLDPTVTPARFANTLAHELHHIGLNAACPDSAVPGRPAPVAKAAEWLGAFGEGLAMLAAAGGPDVHPHAVSSAEERREWDANVAHTPQDLPALEAFYGRILDGQLTRDDSIFAAAESFFGKQGPFYTAGWLMWSTIEREFGHARLLALECNMLAFPATYNEAARRANAHGASLPLWSDAFIGRLSLVRQ